MKFSKSQNDEEKISSNYDQKRRLAISPLEIPGETKVIPVDQIEPGIKREESISISEAIVAFLDIMGFSKKTDDKDIEACLLDFSGSLIIRAKYSPHVRFNVFSDCAFLAAPLEKASTLISVIRSAFKSWIADGLLIRGGLAIGEYQEPALVATDIAPNNYSGNTFAGSGVTAAVKLEGSGPGSLLFTSQDCARFLTKEYNEVIFRLRDHLFIGWTDEDSVLYWFTGISFIRLLRFLNQENGEKLPISKKLLNNLKYVLNATNSNMPWFTIYEILLSPFASEDAKTKAKKLLNIDDSKIPQVIKDNAEEVLATDTYRMLRALAEMDSGLPKRSS